MMGPALPPGAVGQEMLACGLLGGVLGAARAVLPTRGRAAPSGRALPLQIFGFWSIRITSDAP